MKRDWQAGVYLHLEASEFIEALRGKHGCPIEEAGDTLFVLLSICAANGIKIDEVVDKLENKISRLSSAPSKKIEGVTKDEDTGPCCTCKKPTYHICANCVLDKGYTVSLCLNSECHSVHRAKIGCWKIK